MNVVVIVPPEKHFSDVYAFTSQSSPAVVFFLIDVAVTSQSPAPFQFIDVESLINEYLKDQPLEKSSTNRKPDVTIKLQTRSKTSDSHSPSSSTFNFSSSKNMGILGGGAAAVIAIIVLVGFPAMNPSDVTDSSLISTANNPLLITVDQSKYQRADIISISGDTISYNELVTLSIENTNGIKIWKEDVVQH